MVAAAGITPLVLPTLLGVGPVTTYLLDGEPLTLVDTGPAMLATASALEAALAGQGRRVEDLELLVITHHHHDHFGLAGWIAGRSGARVAAPLRAVDYLTDYDRQRALDTRFRTRALRAHGVPAEVVEVLGELSKVRSAWGAPVTVDIALGDGDELAIGRRSFTVHERPGHSETDIVLLGDDGVLVAGDHLLPDISSNAVFARPLDGSSDGVRRNPALAAYARSLAATRSLDADVVLPGHGAPFRGHRELVDRRVAAVTERAEQIAELLLDRPQTAYELARRLWPRLAATQASLTVSEVLGHVQLLLDDGRVAEADDGAELVRFVARSA